MAYHLERSRDLVIRLGDGTAESHARMKKALDELWSYTGEMFVNEAHDAALAAAGLAPEPESLEAEWNTLVAETLCAATLGKPQGGYMHRGGKRGLHTEHLGYVLAEMQFLQRAYPGASW